MSFRRLRTLTDLAHQGYWLRLSCRCGYVAEVEPMQLLVQLSMRHSSSRLADLHKCLRCSKCGGRDFSAEHCQGPPMWSR